MGYTEYLKDMLRPVGVYDLDSGAGAAELEIAGGALDALFDALETAEAESGILTAQDVGLKMYERLLPFGRLDSDVDARRRAVAALLRINETSFTISAIAATLAGAGLDVEVTEGDEPQTAVISFPGVYGTPANMQEIKKRIEAILPCHIGVEYSLRFVIWRVLEAAFASWSALEAAALTWAELEALH